ncbi:MAG: cytochrome c3 family protein [Candidatus Thiodiazotropha sp. (ex Dulcina madagascariensis)]|nr:cytochrome c3 family protein [Candidatus Thiodiazotropha sp. (ex Dulcina madagascariensis)]MCU7927921.1 cytochrome c3 family protein [Candidatus Thiodiazotropha sp. (ex Dulcina madagascariensis)]
MFCATSPVFAGKLDLLLMPGPVIAGHAEFEEKCESCHETLKKADQVRRCLSCHDHSDVAEDVEQDTGFHGRLDKDQVAECKRCHTEHKGRDKDIVNFDTESFDHSLTDFELKGAHRPAACRLCHTQELKKYSQAPSVCFDCHEADDSHQGKLGKECDKCHSEKSWQEQKFDHDVDTEYKLIGKHKELDCKLCHAGEHYKNTPKECIGCHLINDAHNGRYGKECEKCHASEEWKELVFDHDKDTEFTLKGRHKDVPCDTCHSKGPYEEKPSKICFSCHEKDDEHKGRNGEKCEECHRAEDWKKVKFDHEKDAKFALKGKHRDLVCHACHRTVAMDDLKDAECFTCHRAIDVHKGEQGENCSYCHNENSWNEKVFFEHDITRFPLIGIHSVTSCESCHLNAEYQQTDIACLSCHGSEDIHEGRMGENCGNCHNPNAWLLWTFDHDTQTDFALEGRHNEIFCHACHRADLTEHKQSPNHCYGCHRGDDIHRGGFGRHCDRCHSSETFEEPEIR